MAQPSRMDQFTADKMGRNLRKYQYLFCERLKAVELLRQMGNTLSESSVGTIKAACSFRSPHEGMDEFLDCVKKKRSAIERFRDILRSSPDNSDLADLLEEDVSARPRTNAPAASNVPTATSSQRQTTMPSVSSQRSTRDGKPTRDTKLEDLSQAVFSILSANLQTTDVPGMDRSWKALAGKLDFTHNDVTLIGKMRDPVDKFLQLWIQGQGENCTLGKLVSLLYEIERIDIIDEIKHCTGYRHESQSPLRQDGTQPTSREIPSPPTHQNLTASRDHDVPQAIDRMFGHVERTTELANQNLENIDGKKNAVVSVDAEEAEQKSRPLANSRSKASSRSSVKDTVVSAVATEADNKRRTSVTKDTSVSVMAQQPDQTGPAPAQESEEPGSFHPDLSNESPLQMAQRQEAKELLEMTGENVVECIHGTPCSARPGFSNVSLTHSIDDNSDDSIKLISLPSSVSDDSNMSGTERQSADIEKGMLENVQRDKQEKAKMNERISLNVRGSQEIREQSQRNDSNSSHELVSAQDTGDSQFSLDSADNGQTKIKTVYGDDSSLLDAQSQPGVPCDLGGSHVKSRGNPRPGCSDNVSSPSSQISGQFESEGQVNSGPAQSRTNEEREWSALTNFQRFKKILEANEANQNASLDLSSKQPESALKQPVLQRDISSNKTLVAKDDYGQNALQNDSAINVSLSNDCPPERTVVKSLGVEIAIAGAKGGSKSCSENENLSDGGDASASGQYSADQTDVKSVGGVEIGIAQTEGNMESSSEHQGVHGQKASVTVEKESETSPYPQVLVQKVIENGQSSDADIGSSFGCSTLEKCGFVKPVLKVEELHDLEGAKQAGLVQDVSDSGKCSTYCGDDDCSLHKVSAGGPDEEQENVSAANDILSSTAVIALDANPTSAKVEPEPEQLRSSMHLQDSQSGQSRNVQKIGKNCSEEHMSASVTNSDRGVCSAPTSMTDNGVCSVQDPQFSSMPAKVVELSPQSAQRRVPQFNTNNNSTQQTTAVHDNDLPVISKPSKHFGSKELGEQSHENVSQNNDTSDTISQHSITLEQGEVLTKPTSNKYMYGESGSIIPTRVSQDTIVSHVSEAATECPAKTCVVSQIESSGTVDSEIGKRPNSDQEMQPNSRLRTSETTSYEDSIEELEQGFEPELRPSCENVVTIGRVEVIQNLPIRKARISRVQFDTDDEGLNFDEEALERHLKVDFTGGLGHTFRSTEDVHYGPKNTASVLEMNKSDDMKRSASCDDITPIKRKQLQRIPSKEESDSVGCFPKKLSFLGCCTGGKLPKLTSKPFKQSDIYKKWMSFSWQKEGSRKSTASESDKDTIGSNTSTPDPDMHLKEPVFPTRTTKASSNETLELDVDPSLVGDSGIGTSENTMLTASRTLSDYSDDIGSSAELNLTPQGRKQRSLTEIFDSLPNGSNLRHTDRTQGWDVIWQNGTPVGSLTCLTDEHHYKSRKISAGKKGSKSDVPKKCKKESNDDQLESSGSHNELDGSDSGEPGRDRCFSLDTWISDDIEASLSGIEEITSPSSAFPPKLTKTGKETALSFETKSEPPRRKSSSGNSRYKDAPIRFLRVVTSTPVKGDQVNPDVDRRRGSGKQGKKGTLKPLSLSPEKIRSRQPASSPSSSHSHSAKFLYDNWSPSPSRSSSEVSPAENQESVKEETSSFYQRTPSAENLVPGMTSYIHNIEKTVVGLTNSRPSFQQNQPGELITSSPSQTNVRKLSDGECRSSRKSLVSGNEGKENRRDSKQSSSSPSSARKHTDFGETVVTRLVMPDSNTSDRVSPSGQRPLRASQTPPSQHKPMTQKVGVEFGVTPNVIPTTQVMSTPAIAVKMETVSEMSGEVTVSSANTTPGSSGSRNQASSTPMVKLESKNCDAESSQRRYVGQSAAKMAFLSGNTVRDPINGNKYFYRFKNQGTDSIVGETKSFQGDCDVQEDGNSVEVDLSSETLPSESNIPSEVTPNLSSTHAYSIGTHETGRRNSDSSVPPPGRRHSSETGPLEGAVGGRETSAVSSSQKGPTGAQEKGRRMPFGSDNRKGHLRTSQSVDGAMAEPSRVFDIGIGALRCAMSPSGIDVSLKLSSPNIRRHVLGQQSDGNQRRLLLSNQHDTVSGMEETGQGSSSSRESSVETQEKKNNGTPTLRITGNNPSDGQSELQHFENMGSQEEAVPATEIVPDSELALCSQSPVINQLSSSPHERASQVEPPQSCDASDISASAPALSAAPIDLDLFDTAPAQRACIDDLDLCESVPAPQVAAYNHEISEPLSVPLVTSSNHDSSVPAPRAVASNLELRMSAPGPERTLGVPRMNSAQGGDENNNVDEKRRKQSPESEQGLPEYQGTGEEKDDHVHHEDARVVSGIEKGGTQTPQFKVEVDRGSDETGFSCLKDGVVVDDSTRADAPVFAELEQDVQIETGTNFVTDEAVENEVQINNRTDVGLPVVAETDAAIENVAIIDNTTENTMDNAVEIDKKVDERVIAEALPDVKTAKASIFAGEAKKSKFHVVLEADSPVFVKTEVEPDMEIETRADIVTEDNVKISGESDAPLSAAVEHGTADISFEPMTEMKTRNTAAFEDSGIGLDDITSGATCLEMNLDLASTSSGSLPDIINLTKSGSFEEESLGDDDAARRSLPDVVVYNSSEADNCENIPKSELSSQLKESGVLHQSPKLLFGKCFKDDAVAKESGSPDQDGDASASTLDKATASSVPRESSHVSSRNAQLNNDALTITARNADKLELSHLTSSTENSDAGSSVVLSLQASNQERTFQNHSAATQESTDIVTPSGCQDASVTAQSVSMEKVHESLYQSPDKLSTQTPQSLSSGDIREETCHWDSLPFERDVESAPTQSGSLNINPPTVAGIKLPQFVSSLTRGRNNEVIREIEGSIERQVGVKKEASNGMDVEDEITGDVPQTAPFTPRADTLYPEQTSGDMTVRPSVNTQTVTEDTVTSSSYSDEVGQQLQGYRGYHQQDLSRPTMQQEMIKVQHDYGSHTDSRKVDVGPTLSHYREQEDSMTSHSMHQGTLQLQSATTMDMLRDDSEPIIQGACHYPQQDATNSHPPTLSTHQETLEFENVSNLGLSREHSGPILRGACHYSQQDEAEFMAPAQGEVMNFTQFQEIVSQLDESSQYNIPNIQAELQTLDDDAYEICSIIVDEIFNKAMAYIEDREMRIFSAFGIAQRPQSRVFTAAGAARGPSMAGSIMLPGVESRLMPVEEHELDGIETEQTVTLGGASDIVGGATSGEVEPLDEKGLIKKSVDICKKFAPYAAGSATFGTLAYLMYKKLKTI